MAKDDWDEMIKMSNRYLPAFYYMDELSSYTNANANEEREHELNVLRERCGHMKRDLIAERQKNKKLQEQLNELLEEMREC